jgi:hypothetical protein
MATHTVHINRAPVLTLWAAVVAERLGYDHEAALTLGKAVAGLKAQSKGWRLGIVEEAKGPPEARAPTAQPPGEPLLVSLLHRRLPVISAEQEVRATGKGQPTDPVSVRHDLAQKFGHALADALYEQFRPNVPEGKQGWGAAGPLDLDYIRALAE